MDDGRSVRSTSVHPLQEPCDSVGVLAFFAKLVASEVPVCAVACAGGLYVGALLACLPAAGEHDRTIHGRALLAVDVLGVGKPQRLGVLVCELQPAV